MAPVSETTIRRRTSRAAQRGEGYAAEAHVVVGLGARQAEPVGEGGRLVGLVGDDRHQRPGADPQAGARVAQVGSRRRAARRVRRGRRGRASSASTLQIRRAATRARISLLAYSVAVRSGIIRKAA